MTAPTLDSETVETPRAPEQRLLSLLATDVPVETDAPPAEPEVPATGPETASGDPTTAEPAADPALEAATPEPPPEDFEEVTVDGETVKVTKTELKRGYSYAAHNTRTAQKLAAERKALEAKEREVAEAGERYLDRLTKAEALLQAQMGAEPDWAQLRAESTDAEYAARVADWQVRERRLTALQRERESVETERQHRLAEEHAKRLAAEQDHLLKAIPEWTDPAKAQADMRSLAEFAMSRYGMSQEDLAAITDHRAVLLLRDAKYAHDLRSAKPKIVTPKAPAVAKPGAQVTKAPPNTLQAARDRLKRTGSLRDAEAVFFAAIEAGEV